MRKNNDKTHDMSCGDNGVGIAKRYSLNDTNVSKYIVGILLYMIALRFF